MAGPLGGAGGKVRQRPPPKLKTSMAGSPGVLAARSGNDHPEVEDVDGAPPVGAGAGDPGARHLRSLSLGQGGEWL
jgi:hypothetical protein